RRRQFGKELALRSCCGQFSDVCHVARLDRTHLCRPECHHSHRSARKSHEFDLVTSPTGMNVNHRPNVAGFESHIRDIFGQDNAVVLIDHHSAPRGYAVISRGATSPPSGLRLGEGTLQASIDTMRTIPTSETCS